MRVAFLGNADWSVPSLRALAVAPSTEVVGVFTRPPVPAGRGSKLTPTPVAEAAVELGLPSKEFHSVASGEGMAALTELGPDVLAVVAYGEILPLAVLRAAPLGAVNLHFSLLPAYRGAAPVQRALLDGCTSTGVTTMLMDEGMDTGPILMQEETAIGADDDSGTLGGRMAEQGAELLARTVAALASGTAPQPRPQDDAAATYAHRITRRDIDFRAPAEAIRGLVRALAPAPGAVTTFRGQPLKVLRVQVAADGGGPGTLVSDGPAGPVIAAGTGGIRLVEVAPAGRKRMSGADFSRGTRLAIGDRFGGTA